MTLQQIQAEYADLKAAGIKLDLTRGKPSSKQLDLSAELLKYPAASDITAEGNVDTRNYGGAQGLVEARRLFTGLLGAPVEQIILGNNASLALMHDVITYSLLKGASEGSKPWGQQEIAFICPVPGYDRHFRICQDYGIRMIPVALGEDGPDMDAVEALVAKDASIKGIWCVPKYSNPSGTVYSDAVIERLAAMKTAAEDFRIFWDNAYGVHHLTDEHVEIANLLELCAKHGSPDRALVFASTSKITFAGAGICAVAGSPANVKWLLARMAPRTIGPDKINQLRHARFLKDAAGVLALMEKHKALLAPKFDRVLEIFERELSGIQDVVWTRPKGGYFISLDVPAGCARRVIALAKDAGVLLTPAGSCHPLANDSEDRTIRIAPSFPELDEVEKAAAAVTLCVRLAAAEKGIFAAEAVATR